MIQPAEWPSRWISRFLSGSENFSQALGGDRQTAARPARAHGAHLHIFPDRLDPKVAREDLESAILGLFQLVDHPALDPFGQDAEPLGTDTDHVAGEFEEARLPDHENRMDAVLDEPRTENLGALDPIGPVVEAAMIIDGDLS